MQFQWPLQTLLDVTAARVLGVKAELFDISGRIARAQRDIQRRRDTIRRLIDDLGQLEVARRIEQRHLLMPHLAAEERRIDALGRRIAQWQEERQDITRRLADLQGRQDNLERLREEALGEFRRMEQTRHQQELDDLFQVSYTRRLQQQRIQASA